MSAPREMYANTLARFGTEAFEFLESECGFVGDPPTISPQWNATQLVYRSDRTFVVIDMAPREATFNICVGRTVDGGLPPYPIFRPADAEPLQWIPIWALAERAGETIERFRFPGPNHDELRSELGRWSAVLRKYGAEALAAEAIDAVGALLPQQETAPDLSRPGEQPPLVIGQSQTARVMAYAQATGASAFVPKDVLDDKPFLQLAASFMRGALQKGLAIRDIGPDPLIKGDGGFLYSLWRGVIGHHGGPGPSPPPPREGAHGPNRSARRRNGG